MARGHGKISTSFWNDPRVRGLSEDARNLLLYLFTSPHSTAAGCYIARMAYICDDLQWTQERVSKGFRSLSERPFATFDPASGVVYLPGWWDENPMESENVAKHVKKLIDGLPDCTSKTLAINRMLEFKGHHKDAIKYVSQHFRKGSVTPSEPLRTPEPEPEPDINYPPSEEVPLREEGLPAIEESNKPETLAVDAYNAIAEQIGIPPCQRLSTARRAKLAKRLSDCGGVTGWEAALAKLRASDFCAGKNDRGWKADFDFMLQEKSFTRLLEGFYDNRAKTNGKPSGQDIAAAHYAGLANALGFGKMGTDGTGPGDEGSTIDGDFEVIGADGPGQPPRLCPSDERPHPIRPSLRDTVPRPGDGPSDLSRTARQAAG
jgi:hypothetical protein